VAFLLQLGYSRATANPNAATLTVPPAKQELSDASHLVKQ
jgi:hypothetical protein